MVLLIILGSAMLWLASLGAWAFLMRRLLRVGWPEAVLAGYPLWWMAQVLTTDVLSVVHRVDQPALLAATIVLALVGLAGGWALRARSPWQAAKPAGPVLATDVYARADGQTVGGQGFASRPLAWLEPLLIGAYGLLSLVLILLNPCRVYDTQAYHLPTIAHWLQQGSLADWPTACLRQITRTHGATIQQLWVVGLAHADPLVELPSLVACGVCALFLWCMSRRWGYVPGLVLVAVLSLWAVPQIFFASLSAKDDLMMTAVLLCALANALLAFQRDRPNDLIFAALAGMAVTLTCGAKLPGLLFGLTLMVVVAVWGVCLCRRSVVLVMVAVVAVTAWPVFLHKYVDNLMRYGLLFSEQQIELSKGGIPVISAAVYYAKLFIAPLIRGIGYDHDDGNFGMGFMLLIVPCAAWAVVRVLRRRADGVFPGKTAAREWRFVASLLACNLPVILLRVPDPWDQRFMIWLCPLLFLLALPGLVELLRPALLRMIVVLLSVSVVLGGAVRAHFEIRCPLALLWHKGEFMEVADFGAKAPYSPSGYEVLRQARPGDAVLYIGGNDTWEYPCWGWRLDRTVLAADTIERLRTQWAERHQWVVLESAALPAMRDEVGRLARADGYEQVSTGHDPKDSANWRIVWHRSEPQVERGKGPMNAAGRKKG